MPPKDATAEDTVFKNVTRLLTPEERARVERINLDPKDIDHFLDLVRRGLVQAASAHDAAVQDNVGLSVEASIRLTRPVYNQETDSVEELKGKSEVQGQIAAKKIYKKP